MNKAQCWLSLSSWARWIFLSLVTIVRLGPTTLNAQTAQVGCLPNTFQLINGTLRIVYPCVYVANEGENTVSVIDASTNSVVGNPIRVGDSPRGVAVTPDNKFVYVANRGAGTISVIATATNTVTTTIQLRGSPEQIAITPNGLLAYVVEPNSDAVPFIEVIDTRTNQVISADTLSYPDIINPTAIAFSPNGATAYVADSCNNQACVQVLSNVATQPTLGSPILVPNTLTFSPASIAVTPDGSLVCLSIVLANVGNFPSLGIAFINATSNAMSILGLGVDSGASDYGLGMTSNNMLYLVQSSFRSVSVVGANPPAALKSIVTGPNPTGIATSADGSLVYVSNANNLTGGAQGSLSVIDTATNTVLTSMTLGIDPQGVGAMPTSLPVIVSQPAGQTVAQGQVITLSVSATGTPPLSYQWFQGQSGDTSAPLAGATGSSFTTTVNATTSFWVQVSNLAGSASSNTATVIAFQSPICTLSLQGTLPSTPFTVTAVASCTDPQLQPLTTSLSWGDGSPVVTASGGSITQTHAFTPSANSQPPNPSTITVTATDVLRLQGNAVTTANFSAAGSALAVFAGQTAVLNVSLTGPAGARVTFQCTTVTDSKGIPHPASELGITCNSNPFTITFLGSNTPVTFAIEIHTTGLAASLSPGMRNGEWAYALWLAPALFLLSGRPRRNRRSQRVIVKLLILAGVLALLVATVSCSGFTVPATSSARPHSTPAGDYAVTVVDVLAADQGEVQGFVQTSLIVPLKVSEFQ